MLLAALVLVQVMVQMLVDHLALVEDDLLVLLVDDLLGQEDDLRDQEDDLQDPEDDLLVLDLEDVRQVVHNFHEEVWVGILHLVHSCSEREDTDQDHRSLHWEDIQDTLDEEVLHCRILVHILMEDDLVH